jgi:hypothetical protein
MLSTSSVMTAAVQILQQANANTSSDERQQPSTAVLSIANGVAAPGVGAQSKARAKLSEALFDQSVPTVIQKKIELMRRVGDEFGLKVEDFESASKFGAAIREKIGQIKLQPGGALALAAIEKKVGLDKLGISLEDFVDAMMDPKGSDAEKLDAALTKSLGDDAAEDTAGSPRDRVAALQRDDLGLYGR